MIVVTTHSGAVYAFDNKDLTWQREHATVDLINLDTTPTYDHIDGLTAGFLARPIDTPVVGERFFFDIADGRWICTTPVVTVEEV